MYFFEEKALKNNTLSCKFFNIKINFVTNYIKISIFKIHFKTNTLTLLAVKRIFNIEKERLLIYIVLYFFWGLGMNAFGEFMEIAKFNNWWQVISCYLLYMVPISIYLKQFSYFNQYAYGLIAMGILEFGGYALETSYVYPNNILIEWFGPYTFALVMTLFFAMYFPLGNYVVNYLYGKLLFQNVNKNLQM